MSIATVRIWDMECVSITVVEDSIKAAGITIISSSFDGEPVSYTDMIEYRVVEIPRSDINKLSKAGLERFGLQYAVS